LVFFGRQQITHVAMALNDHEYIHSEGQRYNRVAINSFDPADAHYDKRLDEIFWDAKRLGGAGGTGSGGLRTKPGMSPNNF
jgi:hypothetical protein